MTQYLIIVFKGVPNVAPETFTTTLKNWEYLKNFKFTKPVVNIDNTNVDIRQIFQNCEVITTQDECPNYLNSKNTLLVIQKIMQSQKSKLDDAFY